MINQRRQSVRITGYYQYLSQIRHRVNVTPNEGLDNEETMKQTPATITAASADMVMDNGNKTLGSNSSPTSSIQKQSSNVSAEEVKRWSSTDVQHWIEQQCQNFELKKATSEKFQMNGQALVLLTKHDFLRRSPDGGEILYYALQRLIKPNKLSGVRVGQSLLKNGSSRQNPRIVELDSDTDEHNSATDLSSSTKPIVEDPDDPPLLRKSDSDTEHTNHHQQHYSHPFSYNNSYIRQPVFTMPASAATTYFHQQQQGVPNAFMYAQHHHHVHPHIPQQQYYQPHSHAHLHFTHQYYPMMAAQGILIEVIDEEEPKNVAGNGVDPSTNETAANGASADNQERLYLVTMNGQQYVMNEDQIKQFATEIHQHQIYHNHQQQQQHFQQQQYFQQQQQQYFQQQQQQQQQQQPSQDNIYYTS